MSTTTRSTRPPSSEGRWLRCWPRASPRTTQRGIPPTRWDPPLRPAGEGVASGVTRGVAAVRRGVAGVGPTDGHGSADDHEGVDAEGDPPGEPGGGRTDDDDRDEDAGHRDEVAADR